MWHTPRSGERGYKDGRGGVVGDGADVRGFRCASGDARLQRAGEELLGDFLGDGVDGFFADALGAECGEGDGGEVEVAGWLCFDFR